VFFIVFVIVYQPTFFFCFLKQPQIPSCLFIFDCGIKKTVWISKLLSTCLIMRSKKLILLNIKLGNIQCLVMLFLYLFRKISDILCFSIFAKF